MYKSKSSKLSNLKNVVKEEGFHINDIEVNCKRVTKEIDESNNNDPESNDIKQILVSSYIQDVLKTIKQLKLTQNNAPNNAPDIFLMKSSVQVDDHLFSHEIELHTKIFEQIEPDQSIHEITMLMNRYGNIKFARQVLIQYNNCQMSSSDIYLALDEIRNGMALYKNTFFRLNNFSLKVITLYTSSQESDEVSAITNSDTIATFRDVSPFSQIIIEISKEIYSYQNVNIFHERIFDYFTSHVQFIEQLQQYNALIRVIIVSRLVKGNPYELKYEDYQKNVCTFKGSLLKIERKRHLIQQKMRRYIYSWHKLLGFEQDLREMIIGGSNECNSKGQRFASSISSPVSGVIQLVNKLLSSLSSFRQMTHTALGMTYISFNNGVQNLDMDEIDLINEMQSRLTVNHDFVQLNTQPLHLTPQSEKISGNIKHIVSHYLVEPKQKSSVVNCKKNGMFWVSPNLSQAIKLRDQVNRNRINPSIRFGQFQENSNNNQRQTPKIQIESFTKSINNEYLKSLLKEKMDNQDREIFNSKKTKSLSQNNLIKLSENPIPIGFVKTQSSYDNLFKCVEYDKKISENEPKQNKQGIFDCLYYNWSEIPTFKTKRQDFQFPKLKFKPHNSGMRKTIDQTKLAHPSLFPMKNDSAFRSICSPCLIPVYTSFKPTREKLDTQETQEYTISGHNLKEIIGQMLIHRLYENFQIQFDSNNRDKSKNHEINLQNNKEIHYLNIDYENLFVTCTIKRKCKFIKYSYEMQSNIKSFLKHSHTNQSRISYSSSEQLENCNLQSYFVYDEMNGKFNEQKTQNQRKGEFTQELFKNWELIDLQFLKNNQELSKILHDPQQKHSSQNKNILLIRKQAIDQGFSIRLFLQDQHWIRDDHEEIVNKAQTSPNEFQQFYDPKIIDQLIQQYEQYSSLTKNNYYQLKNDLKSEYKAKLKIVIANFFQFMEILFESMQKNYEVRNVSNFEEFESQQKFKFVPQFATDWLNESTQSVISIKPKQYEKNNSGNDVFQLLLDDFYTPYKAQNIKLSWILHNSNEILKFQQQLENFSQNYNLHLAEVKYEPQNFDFNSTICLKTPFPPILIEQQINKEWDKKDLFERIKQQIFNDQQILISQMQKDQGMMYYNSKFIIKFVQSTLSIYLEENFTLNNQETYYFEEEIKEHQFKLLKIIREINQEQTEK